VESLDPNWFYSTLAQATAAIVGLAGAFLLQRVIAQREQLAPLRQDIRTNCLSLWHDIDNQRTQVETAVPTLKQAEKEAKECVESGQNVLIGGDIQVLATGPTGMVGQRGARFESGQDPQADLRHAWSVLAEYEAHLPASFEALVERIRSQGTLDPRTPQAWLAAPPWTGRSRPPQGAWLDWAKVEDDVVRERWQNLQLRAREFGVALEDLRGRLVPRSFYLLLGVLTGLLLGSVITPLFFLSAKGGPSKPVLIAVFAPLAVAFVGFFGFELWRLRRADRLASETF
jgi:hypothetical protein